MFLNQVSIFKFDVKVSADDILETYFMIEVSQNLKIGCQLVICMHQKIDQLECVFKVYPEQSNRMNGLIADIL